METKHVFGAGAKLVPGAKAAGSGKTPPRGGQTHGFTTLKRAVKALGTRVLDGRTTLAKELAEECRELVNALGGEQEVSPQERALIEMIA